MDQTVIDVLGQHYITISVVRGMLELAVAQNLIVQEVLAKGFQTIFVLITQLPVAVLLFQLVVMHTAMPPVVRRLQTVLLTAAAERAVTVVVRPLNPAQLVKQTVVFANTVGMASVILVLVNPVVHVPKTVVAVRLVARVVVMVPTPVVTALAIVEHVQFPSPAEMAIVLLPKIAQRVVRIAVSVPASAVTPTAQGLRIMWAVLLTVERHRLMVGFR